MTFKRISRLVWFAYLMAMLAFLLFINFKTPIMGEDYAFFIYSDTKVDLAKSIIHSVFDHFNPDNKSFNLRHGDTIAMLMLNLGDLLGIGKGLFSFFNSIVAFIFFMLIFFWSNCRFPNLDSIKDLAVFSVIPIMFLICSFSIGEIFFWCDGASSYLWTGTILLAVGIPYRRYLHDEKYIMKRNLIFGYMVLSYFAAFTNENTVPIIILLGGFLLLRDIVRSGIKKIPIWLLLSVISMGIGYSVLVFSPNTKRRTMVYRDMFNLPEKMSLGEIRNNLNRVIDTFISSNYRFLVIFLFCIVSFVLFLFFQNRRKRQNHITFSFSFLYENIFLLMLSSISIIALFFAPYTEIRTFLFVQIFIISIVLRSNYLVLSSFSLDKYRYLKYLPNIFLCLLSILFLSRLTKWTLEYSQFDRARSESIKNQIAEGKETIVAKMYPIESNKYLNTREDWIRDVTYNGLHCYSRFHGLNEDRIRWSFLSYEELNIELKYISGISMPQDVSNIMTHDLNSINLINDNLILDCGVTDPQLYLSLQEPITRPFGDPYLEIECINNKPGNLQAFYDFGNGLSEENSIRYIIEETSEITKIRLPIVDWQAGTNLYSIRIDPPDGTVFEIKSIKFGEINLSSQ